ncbi:FadR family transcriptional regulator [Mangrovibacillus cuniculi]|uniref:FadR family transcriptional regulator n=2 Tax=Mangrovibacillus cuniculi TaxID=2593652 RepID=A0A7S8CEC5_9BACI|nr:FadR family transcriptional regulator [Mangrovibacillus cuniculi]
MIAKDGLVAGDKLPSERELSDRLEVGRSSVREALRALELLGLIETRRGEGTFLRDFRDHHLVRLLSTFILQDENVVSDLSEMKTLLEHNALRLILNKHTDLSEVERLLRSNRYGHVDHVFSDILKTADNRLLFRIWTILYDYALQVGQQKSLTEERVETLLQLLHALNQKESARVFALYDQLV